MANRMKEDEKNEKLIRGLLKLPANRRCINCNSLVRFFFSILFCDLRIIVDCTFQSHKSIWNHVEEPIFSFRCAHADKL